MTTHELAEALLKLPNVDVAATDYDHTAMYGNDYYLIEDVNFYEKGKYQNGHMGNDLEGPHVILS